MATTTIAINIKGNTADISKKLNQVNAHLSTMGKRATLTKTKMGGLGNSFTGIMGKASALSAGFLGIAAAIRAVSGTIGTMANFGFEMSKVEAISGATGQTLKEMTALAREMGATTMFTATEAAQGLKFLSMAGFDAQEAMKALPATLHLAQAGTIDLARAADISSNIMSAFGLEAARTGEVVDDMVTTVNNANTNVQQLGDAMKYVGAAAAAAGMDIPTVSAAIGVLSNAGMQGAMAGTGLRQVFIRLTNVTGAAEESLAGMGLKLDQVNPQMVGLTEAITRLREAGMTGSEAITIFGARGAVAALNLAKGLPKYHELKDIMAENEGIAKKTANTMENNLLGSFRLLKSAVQEAVLAFGDEGFSGSLQNTIKTITEVVRILAGSGDPLSDFHDRAQMIVIQVRKLADAGMLFFKIWAVSKIVAISTSIIAFAKSITVAATASFAALGKMTMGLRLLSVTAAGLGIGALVLGLGAVIGKLIGVGNEANAAAAALDRMAEVRQEVIDDKTTFDYEKNIDNEGSQISGRLDSGDIKRVEDIESAADLGNQIAIAKQIKEEFGKASKLAGSIADDVEEGYASSRKIREVMEQAGVSGSTLGQEGIENFRKAKKIVDNETKTARRMEQFLSKSITLENVKQNVAAKKHNALIKERLDFFKKIGEENARAVSSEDNRAGKIALIEARKGRTDAQIGGLEGRGDLSSEEKEKLSDLKEQSRVMATQLEHEKGMLYAERAGSKALEEQLELRKEIVKTEEQQSALKDRQKRQFVDPMVFEGKGIDFASGEKTPLDLLNELESFNKDADSLLAKKNLGTGNLIGANDGAFDLYGKTEEILGRIKEFGTQGEFNVNDDQADWADSLYDRLYSVLELTEKAQERIAKRASGAYKARPMMSTFIGGVEVSEVTLFDELLNAAREVQAQMGDIGAETARGFLKRLEQMIPEENEMYSSLVMLRKKFNDKEGSFFDLDGANEFKRLVLANNKAMADQGEDLAAKKKGQLDDERHRLQLINIERQKEINAINKVLTADNRSIEMQKRKLKLIGGQTAGGQIAEIEGKEKIADHMVKYESALRKKFDMQEGERKGGPFRPGDLTEQEIQRRLQEEKGIAANVIAKELVKDSRQSAGFGVSSLAKIGGGGGVGSGGDAALNAAELANKLMGEAQLTRIEGVEVQKRSLEEQKNLIKAIKGLKDNEDPFVITQ